jgi:hypothetical protein
LGQDAGIKLYEYGTDVSGFSKLAYENDVTSLENYVTYLYGTWVNFVSQTKNHYGRKKSNRNYGIIPKKLGGCYRYCS